MYQRGRGRIQARQVTHGVRKNRNMRVWSGYHKKAIHRPAQKSGRRTQLRLDALLSNGSENWPDFWFCLLHSYNFFFMMIECSYFLWSICR